MSEQKFLHIVWSYLLHTHIVKIGILFFFYGTVVFACTDICSVMRYCICGLLTKKEVQTVEIIGVMVCSECIRHRFHKNRVMHVSSIDHPPNLTWGCKNAVRPSVILSSNAQELELPYSQT